jgi:hypothetical protein
MCQSSCACKNYCCLLNDSKHSDSKPIKRRQRFLLWRKACVSYGNLGVSTTFDHQVCPISVLSNECKPLRILCNSHDLAS